MRHLFRGFQQNGVFEVWKDMQMRPCNLVLDELRHSWR